MQKKLTPTATPTELTLTCVVFHHVVVVSVRGGVGQVHGGGGGRGRRVMPPRKQVTELGVHFDQPRLLSAVSDAQFSTSRQRNKSLTKKFTLARWFQNVAAH